MLYCENDITELDKKRRVHIILCIVIAVSVVVAGVLFCVFATRDNKTLFTVLACITVTLGGWVVIGDVFAVIRPVKYRMKQIQTIMDGDKSRAEGRVTFVTHMTVNKWVSAYAVSLKDRDGYLLYDDVLGDFPAAVGDSVSLVISGRFIVDIEVNNDFAE